MESITFTSETSSFGVLGYQVPIVAAQTELEEPSITRESLENKAKKSFREIDQEQGEIILRYNQGNLSYKREHRKEFQRARMRLVKANKGFILETAANYQGTGIDIEELKQLSKIGAYRASRDYDIRKGATFITYAEYWMRNFILKAIRQEKNRAVKIPNDIIETQTTIDQAGSYVRGVLNEVPTEEAVVDYLKQTKYKKKSKKVIRRLVRGIDMLEREVYSTDIHTPAEENSPLNEIILNEDLKKMRHLMNSLNCNQLRVIEHYLGYNGNEPTQNISEIARRLGWSRQLVAHHYNQALKKLRAEMCPENEEETKEEKAA